MERKVFFRYIHFIPKKYQITTEIFNDKRKNIEQQVRGVRMVRGKKFKVFITVFNPKALPLFSYSQ